MKRVITILILFLFVVSFSSCYCVVKYFDDTNIKQYNNLMKIAEEKINDIQIEGSEVKQNDNKKDERNKVESKEDRDIIGILEIEKLKLKAPIKEGTTQDVLKYSIGHFTRSDIWNGNVALASHNRGSYAHYFEDIDKLENGDEIKYSTYLGTRIYTVVEKEKILETNWDKVLEKKEVNTITLVTCITGEKEYRLCVKAIQI